MSHPQCNTEKKLAHAASFPRKREEPGEEYLNIIAVRNCNSKINSRGLYCDQHIKGF